MDLSKIKKVKFKIVNPEDVIKESCAKINISNIYDNNNEPKYGGLSDYRMGVTEMKYKCNTCEQTYIDCPGHFGHIELPKPILVLEYLPIVIKVLNNVCIRCSKLLYNKNHIQLQNILKEKNNRERFLKFKKLTRPKKCGESKDPESIYYNNGCGTIQPNKISNKLKNDMESIYLEIFSSEDGKKKEKIIQELTQELALGILKRISEEDNFIMGFHKDWCLPHWLIITNIPVMPPCSRPSVKMYNNQRSEDDSTRNYSDIIKSSLILTDKLNSNNNEDIIKGYIDYVEFNYSRFINNKNKSGGIYSVNKNGKKNSDINSKINGKEGRIRGNLQGKRVDWSARSVISPDSNLDIDELGVPKLMAKKLSLPVTVNKFNINQIYQLYNENKIKTYTNKEDGIQKYLEFSKLKNIEFKPGDIVERELIDGDYVLFNRQPSLHKMSMMAHKIKLLDGKSFRLNVNVTGPYNADFDGDEMNMHLPRSIQTSIELQNIAGVNKQIISPSDSSPIIKPTQDCLLGLYKITEDGVLLNRKDMMNLLMDIKSFKGRLPEPIINKDKIIRWSGKQLISIILPPINIQKGGCEIINGEIIKGQINKSVSNSIMLVIHNDYNNLMARDYLNDLQKIIINYLSRTGFSVGIEDIIIHDDIKKKNEEIILKAKQEISDMDKQIHLNIFENISNNCDEILEAKSRAIIGKITQDVQSNLTNNIDKNNKIYDMIKSGSKGNATNILQMTSMVGQQDQEGKRIALSFDNRTLPHYLKYETMPESRGFIVNPFVKGLTPTEFFFHAMSGREGLCDTAVKTAKSGYIQRKLVKTTEDLKIGYDLTVRTANNSIVQFKYACDGFSPSFIEKQIFNLHFITNDKLKEDYILDATENWNIYVKKNEYVKMMKSNYKEVFKQYNEKIYDIIDYIHKVYKFQVKPSINKVKPELEIYSPVNIDRLLVNTTNSFNLKKKKTDITPLDIIRMIENINKIFSSYKNYNKLIEYLLYDNLSPNILIKKHCITKKALLYIENFIVTRFKKSIIQPGEMIGIIAAQALGASSTQMSVIYEEPITLMIDNKIYRGEIGKFIDDYFDNNHPHIKYVNTDLDKNNAFINIENKNICVLTVNNETEKSEWQPINQVSRHPVNGGLVKFRTRSGREITSTLSHSHLKRTNEKIVPVNGSDIKIGDRIPVIKRNKIFEYNSIFKNEYDNNEYYLTNIFGKLIGIFVKDGIVDGNKVMFVLNNTTTIVSILNELGYGDCYVIEDNHLFNKKIVTIKNDNLVNLIYNYFMDKQHKIINKFVINTNIDFINGILEGYIDNFNTNLVKNYIIYFENMDIALMLVKLLGYLNIGCIIDKNMIVIDTKIFNGLDIIPHSNELLNKIYKTERYVEPLRKSVLINHYNCIKTMVSINKNTKEYSMLKKIVENDIIWDEIIDIEYIDDYKRLVYDIGVDGNHTFCLDSGIFTHNTLNTFHYAGVGEKSNVIAGVPRLEELLNKQKPKKTEMNVFLREDIKNNKKIVDDIQFNLDVVIFDDILKSSAIYLESANNFENTLVEDKDIFEIYKVFSELDSDYKEINNNPWLIRLEFDKNKILTKKITMDDIYLILKHNFQNINIIYSDDNSNKLIFRLKINFVSDIKNIDDDYNLLIDFIDKIKYMKIKGINNVKSTIVYENNCYMEKLDNIYNLNTEYYIKTEGSNLFDIMCKNYIDDTRTYCSDINEIYELFGIEVTRTVLEEQITNIFSVSGASINQRHISLLCDMMCHKGKIMPTNRHGINNSDIGPLAKCSFEETQEQLKMAAIFGAEDDIEGVSANIILGQTAQYGTNYSELMLDMEKLKNIKKQKTLIETEEISEDIFNETEEIIDNNLIDINMIDNDDIMI